MATRLSTGIEGLDDVLLGGLLPGKVYLIRGRPGSGKTTLAMQFLLAGARRGETVLFITLSESEAELRAEADSHGWDLGGVHFLDIHPGDEELSPDGQYSVFHPADVELAPVTRMITEAVERLHPSRVVFDSLTEVRLLSRDLVRFRRQILALKSYLLAQRVTTLFIGESGHLEMDAEVTSVVQGVIALELTRGPSGLDRRGVRIEKYRASDYRQGEHALRIDRGGLTVFPRLTARRFDWPFVHEVLPCGIAGVDEMIGGGLDRASVTLLGGNSGVGKSTLGMSFLIEAALRGERVVVYSFDETPAELVHRCEAIGMAIRPLMDAGTLHIEKVSPLGLYPDEFASWITDQVGRQQARVLMIDTLNGYRLCMDDADAFVGHLQQLVGYLKGEGVTTLLVEELAQLTGDLSISRSGMSYITDTILLLKSYEQRGRVLKAVGAIKKRLSAHHEAFREFSITARGIRVGDPLPQLRGILQGEAVTGGVPSEKADRNPGGSPDG